MSQSFLTSCPFIDDQEASYIEFFYNNSLPLRSRFYHNFDHVRFFFEKIENVKFKSKDLKNLFLLAAAYHDIVYIPGRKDNEDRSVSLFEKRFHKKITKKEMELCVNLIKATKGFSFNGLDENQHLFKSLDWACASDCDPIKYEHGIFFESQGMNYEDYKARRTRFLKSTEFKHKDFLIDYINRRTVKTGVYAGTFSHFHIGHKHIIEKSLGLFDKVIVAVGNNTEKNNEELDSRVNSIKKIFPYLQVNGFDGLFSKYVYDNKIKFIIKGLRNSTDYSYEVNQWKINQELCSLYDEHCKPELVLIPCNKELEHVSSTFVKALMKIEEEKAMHYIPTVI